MATSDTTTTDPDPDRRRPLPETASVGVVGAGISGLAVTRTLDRAGESVVALEAADRPGGVIATRECEGRTLDLGPQRTRLVEPVRELVEELDLSRSTVAADPDLPLFVVHDGELRRAPLSPTAALKTDLLSTRGKLRVLLEPVTGAPREGESVAAFLRRSFGPEFARRVAGPLYAGLYGSDPAEMPVEHSLGKALDEAGIGRSVLVGALGKLVRMRLRGGQRPPAVSFEDGMATLPRALFRAHADRIHCRTPVDRIRESGRTSGNRDGRYLLETRRGTVAVDDVVVTTPAPVAGALLSEAAPDASERLESLRYNPLAVVHLSADLRRDGMGFLAAEGEETPLLGSTWNGRAFDRDDVVTCYLGGADRPDLVSEADEGLAAVATAEFERITGANATPLGVHRWSRGMPAYDRSWRALEGLELPGGIHLCANFHARAGIPGRIREARALADRLAGTDGDD